MKPRSFLLPFAPALIALMMLLAATGTASAQCCTTFTVDGSALGGNCFPLYFSVLWSDGTVQADSLTVPGIQTYTTLASCPPNPSVYVFSVNYRQGCCVLVQINNTIPGHCAEIQLFPC